MRKRSLEEVLVNEGLITPDALHDAQGRINGERAALPALLVQEGIVSEAALARARALQHGLPYSDLADSPPDSGLLAGVPLEWCRTAPWVPLGRDGDAVVVAVADPSDLALRDSLQERFGRIRLVVAPPAAIRAALEGANTSSRALQELATSFRLDLLQEDDDAAEVRPAAPEEASASPIIRLVDTIVLTALERRASDIHLEATEREVQVKFRVDGILYPAMESVDKRYQAPLISRIKVMAELDIAESRVPQDGRFKLRVQGRAIDFRVSILPSAAGEAAVIRILDKEAISASLAELRLDLLGFPEGDLRRFRRLVTRPHGMVLVTGPTGSGKTTTLYAAITELHRGEEKFITIEDPIEYQLQGVVQIPVNEKKGLTFARGLRSILRHDPDRILVGEIRDPETAQIAVQAALTGHLVFTTVHANNIVDVLGRFLHMGLEPYNFASSLLCVLTQRLVRTVCDACSHLVTYAPAELEEAGLDPAPYGSHTFRVGTGCPACHGTGYRGRTGVFELVEVTDRIRELILARRPGREIREAAQAQGTTRLREAALEKALTGVTTLAEVNRVTAAE